MGLVTTMKERAKAALPSGSHTRTLPSGIGRGLRNCSQPVDRRRARPVCSPLARLRSS